MNFNEFLPYIVEEEFQGGGQGFVYRAHHKDKVSEKYIIKKCKKDSQIAIKRFEREIKTIIKLQNIEGIIKIEHYNLENRWYVMPCLKESDTLFTEKVDLKAKINSLIKLGEMISRIHNEKVAHRDIKPGNILLTAADEIVLADFGIAWEEDQKSITRENERVGPYSFMAPEMHCYVNEKRELKPADIFSFAQVAYCMFYCKRYGTGTIFIRNELESENAKFNNEKQNIEKEPFYQFLEGATQCNPAKRLEIKECLELLNDFLKILYKDNETIKKWEIKKVEKEIMVEHDPDGVNYYDLVKINNIIKKLSKNYYFSTYDNGIINVIGSVQSCIISEEGIEIVYKIYNKEGRLLCFPKKLEIKKENNNLQYYLKINKKDIEDNKYNEYSENIIVNIFESNQNFNIILNKNITLYFYLAK